MDVGSVRFYAHISLQMRLSSSAKINNDRCHIDFRCNRGSCFANPQKSNSCHHIVSRDRTLANAAEGW